MGEIRRFSWRPDRTEMATIQERIKAIESDPDYINPSSPLCKKLRAEAAGLYARLYPEGR